MVEAPPRGGWALVRGRGAAPIAVVDPLALAFDPRTRRTLAYDAASGELVVATGASRERRRVAWGAREATGLALDPSSGALFVLDASASRILRIEPRGADPGTGPVSAIPLPAGLGSLRGLAFNPEDGLLYVLLPAQRELVAFAADGRAVAAHRLAGAWVRDPVAMAFAPTGDGTDDPAAQSLYLATARGGRLELVEWSFAAADGALAAATAAPTLVRTIRTSAFSPPSPDPSGIAYDAVRDRLLASDGEVEEMSIWRGANVFELSRTGSLLRTFSTTAYSDEPVGVAWNPADRHLFISDDDDDRVYEIAPGSDGLPATSDDVRTSFATGNFGAGDAEGVTYGAGSIWIADGVDAEVYRVSPGSNGRFDGASSSGDDVVTHFDVDRLGVSDPEGIEYDAPSGHLFVVGKPATRVAELTTSGTLVGYVDISAASPRKPAGLATAPGSVDAGARSLFIADRGVDNDSDSRENDGKIYEFSLGGSSGGAPNDPPTVSAGADQSVAFPGPVQLSGTASDDGRPDPPRALTTTWSRTSGPGTVTFADASALSTTATFSALGTYVLRLTASDGALTAADELSVQVTGSGGEVVVEVRVATANDDAEQSATGSVSRSSSDLELVADGSNQTVGMRFLGVAIPQGAEIVEAWVQFQVDETGSTTTSLRIEGEDSDDAAAFLGTTGNLSARARTTAATTWAPVPWTVVGAAGPDQRTPSLVDLVQEIVDRPGWASGHALVVLVTGSGKRTAEAYDGVPAAAPLLHVIYR